MRATLQRILFRHRYGLYPGLFIFSLCCGVVFLIGLLLLALRPLAAADGRDFAGSYRLTDIVDEGDTVLATLRRVFNCSDADVADAMVVLDSRRVPEWTYWSFPPVSIVNRASVRRRLVKIPRVEDNSWRHSSRPNPHVDTANADGRVLWRVVEVTRNVGGEEN